MRSPRRTSCCYWGWIVFKHSGILMIIITPHCRGKSWLDFPSHLSSDVPTPAKLGGWDEPDCSSAAVFKGSAWVLHLLLAISRSHGWEKSMRGCLELPKSHLKMFNESSALRRALGYRRRDGQGHPGVRSVLPKEPERSGVRFLSRR